MLIFDSFVVILILVSYDQDFLMAQTLFDDLGLELSTAHPVPSKVFTYIKVRIFLENGG